MNSTAPELGPQAVRIVDAARACVARVGLAKTTLDDVAREAGCARATVYRCFPGKQALLAALVAREAERLQAKVLAAAAATDTLGDAVTAAITTAAHALQTHDALAFVVAYEPELIVPHLAFEREDAVLRTAATLVAPAFVRFLAPEHATRLGEWIARLTLSYLCSPSERVDLQNAAHVRRLVDDFVLPGFTRPLASEGKAR
jgi:AcrR family transcriptional regulator